ncbi:hypothetical protein Hanom_Chr12g01126211 [Helianthus anomalus]
MWFRFNFKNFDVILLNFGVTLLNFDCRGLVHLFWFRCLQMWSADCRHFTSEKTNSTQVSK